MILPHKHPAAGISTNPEWQASGRLSMYRPALMRQPPGVGRYALSVMALPVEMPVSPVKIYRVLSLPRNSVDSFLDLFAAFFSFGVMVGFFLSSF